MKKTFTYCSIVYKMLLLIYSILIYSYHVRNELTKALLSLTYYTIQTNVLIIFMLAASIIVELVYIKKAKKPQLYYVFDSIVTVNGLFLVITYYVLYLSSGRYANLVDFSHHFLIPTLMFVDSLVFYRNVKLKFWYGFLTCLPAVWYMIYSLIFLSPKGICYYPELIYSGMFKKPQTLVVMAVLIGAFLLIYTILWLCNNLKNKLIYNKKS